MSILSQGVWPPLNFNSCGENISNESKNITEETCTSYIKMKSSKLFPTYLLSPYRSFCTLLNLILYVE